jgi:PAS domain S-box-containing protein
MNDPFFEEQAALYVAGVMSTEEREQFELVLEFNQELREYVVALGEIGVAITLATLDLATRGPSAELKSRILGAVHDRPQQLIQDGLVVSTPDGLVHWINPSFSEMCGYTLGELRGKKLGPILQGEKTDRATANRLRHAVHEHRPCREAILNYRKNGEPYWVEIAITPIPDAAGQPQWLVARERELADPVPA